MNRHTAQRRMFSNNWQNYLNPREITHSWLYCYIGFVVDVAATIGHSQLYTARICRWNMWCLITTRTQLSSMLKSQTSLSTKCQFGIQFQNSDFMHSADWRKFQHLYTIARFVQESNRIDWPDHMHMVNASRQIKQIKWLNNYKIPSHTPRVNHDIFITGILFVVYAM